MRRRNALRAGRGDDDDYRDDDYDDDERDDAEDEIRGIIMTTSDKTMTKRPRPRSESLMLNSWMYDIREKIV